MRQVAGTHVAPRDGNLVVPVDDPAGSDHGPEGQFGERARGVLAPGFVRSLPGVARDVVAAIRARGREVLSPAA